MKKTMFISVPLFAAMLLFVSACGGQTQGSGNNDSGIEKIGLTVQALNNPYFISVQKGVEDAASELDATVQSQGARQDLSAQGDQIDTFVTQGVDLIVLNAVDSEGIAAAVKRATSQGIPVVAVDVTAKGADATVRSDNREAGRLACKYIATNLNGEGNLAIVDGTRISAVINRVKGCKEALSENPGIKVVATQQGDNGRAEGRSIGANILTANPNLDAVFAINDPTAKGVQLAAQQANRDDFILTSVDGAPTAVSALKSGGVWKATAAQNPYEMGQTAVEFGEKLVNEEELEKTDVVVPVDLVTQENVDEYGGWQQ